MMRIFRVCALTIVFCAAGIQAVKASTLSLVPSDPSVNVGDSVAVDLNISGLGGGTSLGAFDITVDFSTVLTLESVSFGDPSLGDQLALTSFSTTDAIAGAGSERLIEVSSDSVATLNSMQASSFTLAVLNFTANSAGSGDLSLSNLTLSDASGGGLPTSFTDAKTDVVGTVPEPSTFVLLCGLLALIPFARKSLAA
jgi:hypothetical protein